MTEKEKPLGRAKNTQEEASSEDKVCEQAHAADVANSAEADDTETKVTNTEDTSKEETDEEKTEDHVQEIKQPTEGPDVEGSRETPPKVAPTPLKECPVCKEPFNDDSVIENVFIRKKAEVPEPDAQKEQMCTGCESNAAASYCRQCDDWLCTDCVTAHKRVRMTKDHQISSMEEATASKSSNEDGVVPVEMSLYCKHHPKEKLSLFCEKCEVLTCRDCQLLKHQEHKYHFLHDAADTYKLKLKGSVSLMKDRREALQKCLKQIEERLDSVNKDKMSLQKEILHQADVVVKAVRSRVASVLSSLHSFTEAACKRLSREVGDIGDLVCKFDHCIDFMDAILEDTTGMPLLYSKSLVEAKCRAVYHTQMEPQSLKGQLKLQYRHDVPGVLQLLPSFGAIYINGTKYPPEKQPQLPAASAQNNTEYGGSGPKKVGALLKNLPPQDSHMKVAMNVQGQVNPGSGLSLVVPVQNNRMLASTGASWPAPQGVLPVNQTTGMMSLMVPGTVGAQPRMVTQAGRVPVMTMKLIHQPASVALSVPSVGSSVSSSHMLQGPPPYPGNVDGPHLSNESQAALSLLSGTRRAGNARDPTPNSARPASGGRSTPDRPLSSDGAATSAWVKSEHQGGIKDCVSSSARYKAKKSSPMLAATLGEMQKNLDDVIRSVPLDLTDHIQPISGYDSLLSVSSTPVTTDTSSLSVMSSSTVTATATSSKGAGDGMESSAISVDSGNGKGKNEKDEMILSGENQVKGYSTGNSMPGFTLIPADPIDPNDDYCAACHQGGDVLCCDQCPRVFHLQCHVPILSVVPSGAFVCTLCEDGLVLEGMEAGRAEVVGSKRKAPTGLSDRELRVCERILLELFCHPSSIPFHEPVNRAVPNYYKIITSPMDFTNIKCKLSRSHFNHYATVESFLDDCKLVFKNCAVYNAESSEVGKAGKLVREFFQRLVARHLPELRSYVDYSETAESLESERKKRRIVPSSSHSTHSSPNKAK